MKSNMYILTSSKHAMMYGSETKQHPAVWELALHAMATQLVFSGRCGLCAALIVHSSLLATELKGPGNKPTKGISILVKFNHIEFIFTLINLIITKLCIYTHWEILMRLDPFSLNCT